MQRDREQISTPPDGRPMSRQPGWRQDFPIDVPADNYIARRDFTKFMVLTSAAFAAGQLCIAARSTMARGEKPEARRIATLTEIPVGGSLVFGYPEPHDVCILLRPEEGKPPVAYSQKCTHLSCAVTPDMAHGCLHCPCHEGNFDLATGRPVSGPPRRPLPRIVLEVRGEEIWATGVEVRTV